jgi:hypothetical protein
MTQANGRPRRRAVRAPCAWTAALIAVLLHVGCGIYTFSGSSLPSHLKTVDVPLFANQTLEPAVAELVTTELSNQLMGANLLRPVTGRGDASLSGIVTGYSNKEYQYDIQRERMVNVTEYMVTITVSVEFVDNRKNEALYKGVLSGQGIYAFATEKEEDGRKRAVEDVVRQVLEHSVQSW